MYKNYYMTAKNSKTGSSNRLIVRSKNLDFALQQVDVECDTDTVEFFTDKTFKTHAKR